ncbi:MAG: glycosyltransferase [Candidatus Competibacter sp.]|nr:glycosyltransferase [Candidatus Competibacter sp.]
MNILFVLYSDFTCNSINHIAPFAAELTRMGHACAVAVPYGLETIASVSHPRFQPLLFDRTLVDPCCFPDGRAADLLHVWTPREIAREFAFAYLAERPDTLLLVHLEDGERDITAAMLGIPSADFALFDDRELARQIPISYAHPRYAEYLLLLADGVTVIQDKLTSLVPPFISRLILYPGVDLALFQPRPPDPRLRAALGISAAERLIVYQGGMNPVVLDEIRDLYLAVGWLDRQGYDCRLIRTGPGRPPFLDSLPALCRKRVLDLGFVERQRLPELLALADVCVQPGRRTSFNDLRLPSKIPEWLAMAKPVLLPEANIATLLEDGGNCLLLREGTPQEIAAKCAWLFDHPDRARDMGQRGRQFAERHFALPEQARLLAEFYQRISAETLSADSRRVILAGIHPAAPPALFAYRKVCQLIQQSDQPLLVDDALVQSLREAADRAISPTRLLGRTRVDPAGDGAPEQGLRESEIQLQHAPADLRFLMRLFENLHHDTQLAFQSLTWRLGFAIAEAFRRLTFRKRIPLVQDHVTQTFRTYQNWRRKAMMQDGAAGPDMAGITFAQPSPPLRLTVQDAEHLRGEIARWKRCPLISILMPVYNVAACWLEAAVESVRKQIYPHWQICIVDDKSTRQETLSYLHGLQDQQIKIVFLEKNQGIAGASNTALALASGEFIALMDNDDELTPEALYEVAKVINEHDPDLIYSDEDKLTLDGKQVEPHFKPDYSPDLLFSMNYISHLSVYRRNLVEKIGGFRQGYEGSQDYDLVLRFLDHTHHVYHIPKILYHWRMIPGSTAASYESKSHAWEAGRAALEDTLKRRNIQGTAMLGNHEGTYRVRRTLLREPKVSIIIPFKDQATLLRHCLDSILEKTTYQNFEILGVSNNSTDPATLALMERYQACDPRIRFTCHDIPFNYSAINNHAVRLVAGEHLILLNNDMTVITPNWIEALLEHSQRPEVGAVGAKLYYPDGTVQHGGVIVGLGGVAGHFHKYFDREAPGYFCRLIVIQNLSAITAACLIVKKALYEKIGGFNEKDLAIDFNDIDFCLRLREKGYLNVFTPYCELYHHESKSRGVDDTPIKKQRFVKEIAYMRKRHSAILESGDPYYNPNL